ncbi:MAG: undecaprenyl-diphosphatase UppP [Gemmatimonadaceae bacterium]
MTVLQAIVLGLVQGLSEFLPISSSAHLALAPWFLGWEDPGLAFDVALHLGTLVALAWYFRREWTALAISAVSLLRQGRATEPGEWRVVHLGIATIPAGIAGVLLEDHAETVFRSPYITATTLIVLGVLLWAADRHAAQDRSLASIRWSDALLIGLAQVLALVPGVSRSGSTITAARALRLTRESAAVFSFLMSMPIIAAAVVFKLPDAIAEVGIGAPLVAGILAAAVSSWLAIAVLLRYVARHSYGVFAVYRIVLGLIVFVLLATRG